MAAINLLGGLANDDTVVLLRRLVKIAESLANKDAQGRQRIAVDTIALGVTLPAVSIVTTLTDQIGIQGWDRRLQHIQMRNNYANAIRRNLTF